MTSLRWVRPWGDEHLAKNTNSRPIKQVIEEGRRITEISSNLGITEQTVYRWLREYDKYGEEAFKGSGNPRVDNEYKIKLLEKKNKQLEQENEILKKVPSLPKGKTKEKVEFISANKHRYSIRIMCDVLGIYRSSYYYSVNRKPTRRDIENLALTDIIKKIFNEYKGRYGSKRILRELRSRGICVNHKRIERIMKENRLKAKYSCKKHGRYSKAYKAFIHPNHLDQEFDISERTRCGQAILRIYLQKRGMNI